AAEGGVAGPRPRTARASVVTDDHVLAHERPIVQPARPRLIARLHDLSWRWSTIVCSIQSSRRDAADVLRSLERAIAAARRRRRARVALVVLAVAASGGLVLVV